MTQEEKELLLKDLCARLPYEPKARKDGMETSINLTTLDSFYYGDEIILPYLRLISSVTKKEKKEYDKLRMSFYKNAKDASLVLIDWMNAHHFDYRGLIELGIALNAPEGMYNC